MNDTIHQQCSGLGGIPPRVRLAVSLLWASWAISAFAFFANSFLFQGGGTGIESWIGVGTLCLQAVVIYYIARGNNVARILLIILLFWAIPGLLIVGRLVVAKSVLSASASLVGFTLKAIAVFLLFTGVSRLYFSKREVVERDL